MSVRPLLSIVGMCLVSLAAVTANDAADARIRAVAQPMGSKPGSDGALRAGIHMKHTRLDCSHLVHYLYRRAGLAYRYMDSKQLFAGAPGFRRVWQPQAGDLVVWRGHVGIVVDPEQKSFLSALSTGVKIASYESRYWKSKGEARFFRYTSNHN